MATYEDEFIRIDKWNDIEYNNSIRVKIETIDPSIIINASSDENIHSFKYSGLGFIIVPIIKSSFLIIKLSNGEEYSFYYTINNKNVNSYETLENGMQFEKIKKIPQNISFYKRDFINIDDQNFLLIEN